ncbi:MAG: KEOPS complex kinase/ATPase Bud32 [Candidatus Micrarchaeota archaeon]|nr:KEOPS complex kinase/ATPase Bud32 [Candidatus Micrarchaeota archaeon]
MDLGKLIAKGSEAEIYSNEDKIIKFRNRKDYRIKEIDEALRKERNRREARMLKKAREIGLPVPNVIKEEKDYFIMEKIDGKKAESSIETAKHIGEALAKLHNNGIIHGDLTPYNMIIRKNKYHIIDFGLSFFSNRIEDRADDLLTSYYSLREHEKTLFSSYEKNSKDGKEVVKRMEKIKGRVRYANDKGC